MAGEIHEVNHPLSSTEFERVEMRIGTILSAQPFEKAKKPAYQLEIDFGPLGIRRSSAQITTLYPAQELVGRQVVAVVNFPPKQIANFFSECLVLGVPGAAGVVLLSTEQAVANGSRIA
ncbi:MAG: tRNA-binding protein [Sphingobacteriaceae bacterium]|nr:tRNA-binding protein [Sphingobacteriaceae bacterium]